MSYQSAKIELIRDNVVRIHHPELVEPSTYLTASVAAAGITLTVKDNAGFSNTDPQTLCLFEGFGVKTAEIKRINGAVSAGTSLTVQAVTFSHPINTQITKILFDQIEISGASTLTGSKTVIDTVNINISDNFTDFIVTGTTYSFYFARFKNSLSTTTYFGGYSDGVASTDIAVNTIGFIRRNAFQNVNEMVGGRFDMRWVLDQLYLCELDVAKRLKRWSWLTSFNYDLGNITVGKIDFSLPSDIADNKTNSAILGIRVGNARNLEYVDKTEFELIYQDIPHTTLSSTAAIGATSLTLTDSRDFTDSGSVNIEGTSYTYTSNTRATGVLGGLTALSAEITSGTDIWQNVAFGEPVRYTVFDGSLYFDVPPSSSFTGRNIWLDYYTYPSRKDSDSDTLSLPDADIAICWLEMEIKRSKANGELSPTDISLLQYTRKVAELVKNELSGQRLRIIPDVPGGLRRSYSWFRR